MTAGPDSAVIRRRVVCSGRVQGVFFRATTVELSRGYAVVGFVRNLPEGTVELQVQGVPDQVEGLLSAVAEHFHGNITKTTCTDVPPRGDETAFRIRY